MDRCFVCSARVRANAAVTCPSCAVATYCSAACRRVAVDELRHAHHCGGLARASIRGAAGALPQQSPVGVRVFDGTAELVDEADAPVYTWFKRGLTALEPEIWRLPAVNTLNDLAKPIEGFYSSATIAEFIEDDLGPLMRTFFDEHLPVRSNNDLDLLYDVEVYDGMGGPKGRTGEDIFERYTNSEKYRFDDRSLVAEISESDVWLLVSDQDIMDVEEPDLEEMDVQPHRLDEFPQLLFYMFFFSIREAYRVSAFLRKRKLEETEETALARMRDRVHAEKRRRTDAFTRDALTGSGEFGTTLADIPTEIRLLIAAQLPARDALRLALQTFAPRGQLEHESRTDLVVRALLRRDFEAPLEEARGRVAPADRAAVADLIRRAGASVRASEAYVTTMDSGSPVDANIARVFLPSLLNMVEAGALATVNEHGAPLMVVETAMAAQWDSITDWAKLQPRLSAALKERYLAQPTLRLFPYYEAAAVNMVDHFVLGAWTPGSELFLVGDSGLQLKAVRQRAPGEDATVMQVVLLATGLLDDASADVVEAVRRVNAALRVDAELEVAPSPDGAKDFYTRWWKLSPKANPLTLLVAYLLIAVDPSLTSFTRTTSVRNVPVVRFRRTTRREKFALFYAADDESSATANLVVASLATSFLLQLSHDPTFKADDRAPTVTTTTEPAYYSFFLRDMHL